MFARLHRGYAALLTSGCQLLLLVIGIRFATPAAWRISLSLILLLSLLAWLSVLRRARILADTPRSLISSAAQGYVELRGRGRPLAGSPLLSPLTRLPCLWYRYAVERQNGSGAEWLAHDSGESDASFLLEDSTGSCAVDPEGAEVLPARCDQWQEGEYRYRQWLILEHEALAVIGCFRTENAGEYNFTLDEEVGSLLADWKEDMPKLRLRFDLGRDGEPDLLKWELVRAEARREVERRRREESLSRSELHRLGKPDDGRPYLISSVAADLLVRRYQLWAWLHVAIFLAALIGLTKLSG